MRRHYGEDAKQCMKFKQAFFSLCPSAWVSASDGCSAACSCLRGLLRGLSTALPHTWEFCARAPANEGVARPFALRSPLLFSLHRPGRANLLCLRLLVPLLLRPDSLRPGVLQWHKWDEQREGGFFPGDTICSARDTPKPLNPKPKL